MQDVVNGLSVQEALEAVEARLTKKLHAYIKEDVAGKACVTVLWLEETATPHKDVVLSLADEAAALAVVKATNASMNAGEEVVKMLIEMYTAKMRSAVGEGVLY